LCALLLPSAGFAVGPAFESLSPAAAAAGIRLPEAAKPLPPEASMKEWTIMMYTDAKARGEMPYTLKEFAGIEKVGSTPKVNFVIQNSKNWNSAERYLVLKSTGGDAFVSPALEKLSSVDGGDYKVVLDFVNWARARFPARRYALILWGHGSGWEENAKPKAAHKGMGYDWETRNHIRNAELGKILEASGRVDLLMLMACQMQMAEVVYEVRGHAGLIMGSEELYWGPSFVYEPLIRTLDAKPDASPAEIAGPVLAAYKKAVSTDPEAAASNEKNDLGRTFSAIDAAKLPRLAALLSDWTRAVISANEKEAAKYAAGAVLRFGLRGYGSQSPDLARDYATFSDLYHFVELTGSRAKTTAVRTKSEELTAFISKELVVANLGLYRKKHGNYEADAHGISIEVSPRRAGNPFASPLELDYRTSSAFAADSGWADFLVWFSR